MNWVDRAAINGNISFCMANRKQHLKKHREKNDCFFHWCSCVVVSSTTRQSVAVTHNVPCTVYVHLFVCNVQTTTIWPRIKSRNAGNIFCWNLYCCCCCCFVLAYQFLFIIPMYRLNVTFMPCSVVDPKILFCSCFNHFYQQLIHQLIRALLTQNQTSSDGLSFYTITWLIHSFIIL